MGKGNEKKATVLANIAGIIQDDVCAQVMQATLMDLLVSPGISFPVKHHANAKKGGHWKVTMKMLFDCDKLASCASTYAAK